MHKTIDGYVQEALENRPKGLGHAHAPGKSAKREGYLFLENFMEKSNRCGHFAKLFFERFVRGKRHHIEPVEQLALRLGTTTRRLGEIEKESSNPLWPTPRSGNHKKRTIPISLHK